MVGGWIKRERRWNLLSWNYLSAVRTISAEINDGHRQEKGRIVSD